MQPREFCAFHLPDAHTPVVDQRSCGAATGQFARLTGDEFRTAIAAARAAARQIAQRPLPSILAALDAVVAAWTRPQSPWFADALAVLPEVTGFSAPVVRRGLDSLLQPLAGEAVGRLLDAELGDRGVLDGGHAGRGARGPRFITHVLAGNIPGLGFAPMVLSLALRSAVVVKSAAGDPYSAAAFARSIAAVDPELGRCVVVHDWRGGDRQFDAAALDADVVVASGSDDAIAAIARQAHGRFFGHGHKVSFAFVDRHVLDDPDAARGAARGLALDLAQWDQFGCLSPQLCAVEAGGRLDTLAFARLLADEFDRVAVELPPRRLGLDERAAIAAFQAATEWSAAEDRLLTSAAAWSIAVESVPRFRGTCLHRCLRLITLDDAAHLPAWLGGHERILECAGLACAAERRAAIVAQLAGAGVHRVCALGAMQSPDLRWRQSGRPRVADWVEWTIDEGYEARHGRG